MIQAGAIAATMAARGTPAGRVAAGTTAKAPGLHAALAEAETFAETDRLEPKVMTIMTARMLRPLITKGLKLKE